MICQWCERSFTRPHHKGPAPKFCSASCRQSNHRATAFTRVDALLAEIPTEALLEECFRRVEVADAAFIRSKLLPLATTALRRALEKTA